MWTLLASVVLSQIAYPLTAGGLRAAVVTVTVVLGYLVSLVHAGMTRGRWAVLALLAVTVLGFVVEAVGVRTGFPFGHYGYSTALSPLVGGVPLVVPLAWAWMAWPGWLVAGRLVAGRTAGNPVARIAVGSVALASWDLFLDPQMVAEGYWTWTDVGTALPGVPGVPVGNYLGWWGVAVVVMVILSLVPNGARRPGPVDRPMYALYLWTYASSVLAHAVFLGLPATAGWGALGMGVVAIPLAVNLRRLG